MTWQNGAHRVVPAVLAIGWWWTTCCEHDLAEITSEVELAEVRVLIDEADTFLAGAWPSRADAMAWLLDR